LVAQLLSRVGERDFEARRAELTAIREELAIRRMENSELREKAQEKCLRAEEKALKLKAEMAFLAAGGARGGFAWWWPSAVVRQNYVCD
jgi:hypothetical protein